ncbi:cysteine proteinase precursor [Theileria orientalis]|uniref:Cysteine proteinase n=1 Tax=Theileria orientalis TaxID=68886 RepID=A0A976SKP1_THEOR|nr:cysteine proteinase precursor [Theileria orientalis]
MDNIEELVYDPSSEVSVSPETPFYNSVNRSKRRRHSRIVIILCAVLASAIASGIASFFLIRSRSARSFKSGLVKHIEKEYPRLESYKKVTLVDDLLKIYKSGKISKDASLELDMYYSFELFTVAYGKKYANFDKRTDRFIIYRNNYLKVKDHNGKAPYTLELNKFADMSDEEFMKLHHEIKPPKYFTPVSKHSEHLKRSVGNSLYISKLKRAKNIDFDVTDLSEITGEDLDWRNADVPTPVKDQGISCGSCWAFSSVGSVEALYRLYKDVTYDLSEQELVNCDQYSSGCNGGLPYTALEYVHSNGISFSSDLPYDGVDEPCTPNDLEKVFIDSLVVTTGTDVLNKSLVLSPTVVGIAVDPELKLYKTGVYTGKCATEQNHAVLLVGEGYDPESKKRYWVVKNSWGTDWGENGYIRLERTDEGSDKCGILTFGLNPVLY